MKFLIHWLAVSLIFFCALCMIGIFLGTIASFISWSNLFVPFFHSIKEWGMMLRTMVTVCLVFGFVMTLTEGY